MQQDGSPERREPRITWCSAALCAVYSLGIVVTLLVYGLAQEKIMSRPYHAGTSLGEYLSAFGGLSMAGQEKWPTDDDFFQSALLLVIISRAVGLVFALVMMVASRESFSLQAGLSQYFLISFFTVVASACQFEALKYVSFTLQMLGKSVKMFPLMCWGFIVLRKSYKTLDWVVAFVFTGGVIGYVLGGSISPEHSAGNAWLGVGLLAGFIALDSITASYQDRLFAESSNSKYNQMLYINLFSAALASLVFLYRGEWAGTVTFCSAHPLVLMDASVMSLSAVLAQWFVYAQVHGFGTLAFVAIMNVRQVVSIVASILAFQHSVTHLQIAALALCCWALMWQVLGGVWTSSGLGERTPLLTAPDNTEDTKAVILRAKEMAACIPCVARERGRGPQQQANAV